MNVERNAAPFPEEKNPHPGAAAPAGAAALRVVQVSQIPPGGPQTPLWLIDQLWGRQAVGVIGGAPKACKSWMALEMALSVASGEPCLDCYEAMETGPVLVYAAEESPQQVRSRLQGLALVRGVNFSSLDIHLIVDPQVRLDVAGDLSRLRAALHERRPTLLVLDPFVRLHRLDENSSAEVSGLLADLRELQRQFGVAIVLVHHTRKSNGEAATGQTLRGSGDVHAWADSLLYLRRSGEDIALSMEHRWARSGDPLTLKLLEDGGGPHLKVMPTSESDAAPDLPSQVLAILRSRGKPVLQDQVREQLKVRNQRLTEVLWGLRAEGTVDRGPGGWFLKSAR